MALQLPNLKQIYAARDCLKDVLIHDQQLVASIEKIEYAGQIERFGERHYIFKFREPGGPWLIGVSGGYKDDRQIEPGDYVGSMGDAFNAATMKGSAIALLDDMKSFLDGEDARVIRETLDDEDFAGMVAHVKEVTARAGLDVSEEEIKDRITEVLKSGGPNAMKDGENDGGRLLAHLHDARFYPDSYSQSILLDKPALYKKEILKEIRKRNYPLLKMEGGKDAFTVWIANCECRIELKRTVETPMEELRRAASMNYVRMEMGDEIAKAKAELVVNVTPSYQELWEASVLFEAVMEVILLAAGDSAVGIYTGAVVQATDVYLRCIRMSREQQMIPLDNLLWACILPNKGGSEVNIRVDGLRAFGLANILFSDPVRMEDVQEQMNEAYGVAFDFLREHRDPDYEERVMGKSGAQYFAYPMDAKGGGPGTVTLEATYEILMDDGDIIRDNLRDAKVKASMFSRMNRAGFFIRWAEGKGWLTEQTKKELAAYEGPNGLRGYLCYEWDGAPDASLFKEELRPFVAEYYNVNWLVEDSYFDDLETYAMEKLAGTKKEDDAQKAPEESHVLLRWGDKTAEEVGAIIEKRYKAWKKKL